MIRFILKILLFVFLFVSLVFTITKLFSSKVERYNFENYNTEENLVITPKNQNFDYVFLGLSHARNFSRHENHQRVEDILDISFLNYGKGGGKGNVANQHIFLKNFLKKGNTTNNILYIISMPMMFAERLDKNSFTLDNEIFDLGFFMRFLFGPGINKKEKLYSYLRSKYKPKWNKNKPYSAKINEKILVEFDTLKIQSGFKLAYVNGLEHNTFERNKEVIKKTIELAKNNNIKLSFIVTPSTFGKWPGHDIVCNFLDSLKLESNIEVYDFSSIYLHKYEYFYDHHHLNTNGVVSFSKDYLKAIVDKNK